MAARVIVIAGPARSGKTERLLSRYRQALAEGGVGSALWIAPSERSATDIRGRLLNAELSACFSPGVVTFDGFAESVLRVADQQIRPLSRLMKRQLIRQVTQEAVQQGTLKHFAPIADTDGLIDLVAGQIAEWKRLEIWPEQFSQACRRRGETQKDRELCALYSAYQDILVARQLYDAEGRFWSARRILNGGQKRPFERVEFVTIDGFTDFTRTQHEILEILGDRVHAIAFSLPLEEAPCRDDVFDKSLRTLDALRKRFPALEVEWQPRSVRSTWPERSHLESQLFRGPHRVEPYLCGRPASIEMVAASSSLAEVEAIGRRIKRLIVAESVPPGDIAVVFRSLTDNTSLVSEVFEELGIPLALECEPSLDASPAIKAIVGLLQLRLEDWPFRRVLAVITNNYLHPAWPEWREGQAVAATERLIREMQVPSGCDALLLQIKPWWNARADVGQVGESDPGSAATDNGSDWVHRRQSWARFAYPLLRRLADSLEALPQRATQSAWAAALAELADDTGLLSEVSEPMIVTRHGKLDTAAWDRLNRSLQVSDRWAEWLDAEAPTMGLGEFMSLLLDIVRLETVPRQNDDIGRVRILTAPSVRTLSVDYLFFAGLAENAFPPLDRDDRLYSEAEIRTLIQAGLPLVDRLERSQEEMLLFYEVATRANKQLVLSYPALDRSAQPLAPSPYVMEVERAFGPESLTCSDALDLSPIPTSPAPHSPTELRLQAVASALEGDVQRLSDLAAEPNREMIMNLFRALDVSRQRQQGDHFGPFEGVLDSDDIRRDLASQFGPQHLWSPSLLELYAQCPYRFHLHRVLGMEAPEDLSLETNYLRRGRLVHDTLSVVHRRINRDHARPTSPTVHPLDGFLKVFEQLLDEVLSAQPRLNRLETAFREIDRRTLMRWGEQYYEQHAAYDRQWSGLDTDMRPAHFEVRFGPAHRQAFDEDSRSTDRPFALDVGDEQLLITGRIDRIDLGTSADRSVFNVLDYKSGKKGGHKPADIDAGTALQLPLYVMAAEALILADLGAVPWRTAYWFVRDSGYQKKDALRMHEAGDHGLQPCDDWENLKEKIAEKVKDIVTGIRNAEFPMYSVDKECTSRCPFKTVCRVNQARNLGKSWPRPAVELTVGQVSVSP